MVIFKVTTQKVVFLKFWFVLERERERESRPLQSWGASGPFLKIKVMTGDSRVRVVIGSICVASPKSCESVPIVQRFQYFTLEGVIL